MLPLHPACCQSLAKAATVSGWFLVSLVPNMPALFIETSRYSDSCLLSALGKLPALCKAKGRLRIEQTSEAGSSSRRVKAICQVHLTRCFCSLYSRAVRSAIAFAQD